MLEALCPRSRRVWARLFAAPFAFACAALVLAESGWAATAPENVIPPALGGQAQVGKVLRVEAGAWVGADSVAYQWIRCDVNGAHCSAIPDATATAYSPNAADIGSRVRVTVIAQNDAGSSSITTPLTQDVVRDAYRNLIRADRPVAYWPFETGESGVLGDGDGATDADIRTELVTPLQKGVTLEAWLRAPDVPALFFYNGASASNGYGLLVPNQHPNCESGRRVTIYVGTVHCAIVRSAWDVPADRWVHLAMTSQVTPNLGTAWVIYLNGQPAGQCFECVNARHPQGSTIVTSNGLVDEVAVYEAPLSNQRLLGHFLAANPPSWGGTPRAGDVVSTLTPLLTADRVQRATEYEFQLASRPDFRPSSILVASGFITTNEYEVPPGLLRDGQTYYWRWSFRDTSGLGHLSPPSHVRGFKATSSMPTPNLKPLVFVPGIMGSVIRRCNTNAWPDAIGDVRGGIAEELKMLRLDETGIAEEFHPECDPGQATDILQRVRMTGPPDRVVYQRTIELLEQAGYVKNETLFPFPYDWRRGADYNAQLLLRFIDEVRAASAGSPKVNILAHSQGGLVTAAALALPASVGKIHRVANLGTPVLGAAKALGVLQFGKPCPLDTVFLLGCVVDEPHIQWVIENMPGVYELLPSPTYHEAHGTPWTNEGRPLTYLQWSALVGREHNEGLVHSARGFHLDADTGPPLNRVSSIDDLAPADTDVEVLRLVGTGLDAPASFKIRTRCVYRSLFFCLRREPFAEIVKADGDGTVPRHSADLCNPPFDNRNGFPNRYLKSEHTALATESQGVSRALAFLRNTSPPPASAACRPTSVVRALTASSDEAEDLAAPLPLDGVELEVIGEATGKVTDAVGRELGPDAIVGKFAPLLRDIPGGTYAALLGTQTFFLNEPGAFRGLFAATTGTDLTVRVRRYAENALAAQATFEVVAPAPGARVSVDFSPDSTLEDLRLAVDRDHDGTPEEVLAPVAVVDGEGASDDEPPTTLGGENLSGNRAALVMLEATDTGGSGIAQTLYRVDGEAARVYEAPFLATLGARVEFFSFDRAGTREQVRDLVVDDVSDEPRFATRLAQDDQIRRMIDHGGDLDWFTFESDGTRELRLHLGGLTHDLDLELYDNSGVLVARTARRGKMSEDLRDDLPAGTYRVRVLSADGGTSAYVLKLQSLGRR